MTQQNYILEDISNKETLVKLDKITRFKSPIDKHLERAKIEGSTAKYMVTGFNPITAYIKEGVPDKEYRELASAPAEEEVFELVHTKTHDVIGKDIFELALDPQRQNELVAEKLANMAINYSRKRFRDLQDLMSNVDVSKKDCPYRKEQILEWKENEFKKADQEAIAVKFDELIGNVTDGINNTKSGNDAYCEEKDVLLFVSREMGTKAHLALNNKLIADKLSLTSRLLDIIPSPRLANGVLAIGCAKSSIKSDFCIDMIVKDPLRGDTLRQVIWKHVYEHTNLSTKNPLVVLKKVT